jgi:hypothetical protein
VIAEEEGPGHPLDLLDSPAVRALRARATGDVGLGFDAIRASLMLGISGHDEAAAREAERMAEEAVRLMRPDLRLAMLTTAARARLPARQYFGLRTRTSRVARFDPGDPGCRGRAVCASCRGI